MIIKQPRIKQPQIRQQNVKVVVYEDNKKIHKTKGDRRSVLSDITNFFTNK